MSAIPMGSPRFGRYWFDESQIVHEDELPQEMTGPEYNAWYSMSWVDLCRIGPKAIRIPDQPTGDL